jgi:hypothetical protein
MTLDEAIEHCEEKAKGCDSCSMEHKQLADWLRELKVFRKIFKDNKKEPPKRKPVHGIEDGEPEEW